MNPFSTTSPATLAVLAGTSRRKFWRVMLPTTQNDMAWIACWLLLGLVTGCGPTEIDGTYGKRRGTPGSTSVNGTSVLARMFQNAGHTVLTWRRLSPRLSEADVIVWAPDNFASPSAEERAWLESWLTEGTARTLVYIGRDYDATITYWETVKPQTPPEQKMEVLRRLADARSSHATRRIAMPENEATEWFVVRREDPIRRVESLEGPWSDGIAASRAEIELGGRLELPADAAVAQGTAEAEASLERQPAYKPLLTSQDETIVGQLSLPVWDNSKLIFVANGSFLLNLPLVNHEHRKLATRLVEVCGPPGKVYFLESGANGLLILDDEPNSQAPTGLEMFTVWPLGVILLHFAALGIMLACACFPIFGRARRWEVASTSDFGQHVSAVGELLAKTGDSDYALQRLKYYHDHVRRDSDSSHHGGHSESQNAARPRRGN